jgi:F-type H+-transporting ATPase subunit a
LVSTRKRRFGVNRWFILAFVILAAIGASLFPPIAPHILVAPERISETPLFTLPVIGPFYLTNTITTMLVVDTVVILLALAVRNSVKKGSLVPGGIGGAMEALIEVLYNLTESTAGRYAKLIFPWFASIIIVVLISNWMGLIPGMEAVGSLHHVEEEGHATITLLPGVEALVEEKGEYSVIPWFRGMSTDLNFTAALALISVIAVQVVGVKINGGAYFYRFFNVLTVFKRPFFGVMDFIVSLLELISELAKILSFAFRLFGNMFAGMVLLFLVSSSVPVFAPSLVMTFEFFIGLIQAFVFGMLTLVFMSQATQGHGHSDEEHHEE